MFCSLLKKKLNGFDFVQTKRLTSPFKIFSSVIVKVIKCKMHRLELRANPIFSSAYENFAVEKIS
jgi:hypothetical protein